MSNSKPRPTHTLSFFAALAAAIPVFGRIQSVIPDVKAEPFNSLARPRFPWNWSPSRSHGGPAKQAADCGRFLKKPAPQVRDNDGRCEPYGPRQVHLIRYAADGKRVHNWSAGDEHFYNHWPSGARGGAYGRCTIEWVNGFGQVTARERINPAEGMQS